jgi:gamma-glutamylcysteine synthetase
MAADTNQYIELRKAAQVWAKSTAAKLRLRVGTLTLKDKIAVYKAVRSAINNPEYKPLVPSIGYNGIGKLEVDRINFRFAKQGIWLEHGVGKNRRVRSSNARPKPWIAPILDQNLAELADILADKYADIAAGEIKLFIPGIYDRRIRINNG